MRLTIKQVRQQMILEMRVIIGEPGKIDFQNLRIPFSEEYAHDWAGMAREFFVIKGNNDDSKRRMARSHISILRAKGNS